MLRKVFRRSRRAKDQDQAELQNQDQSPCVDSSSAQPVTVIKATSRTSDQDTLTTTLPKRPIQEGPNLGVLVLYEPPEGLSPIVDIVFVHGLKGNSFGTWYSDEKGGTHWPSDLLKVDIPDARIVSFGYDADVLNWWNPASQNRIGNHAENLMGSLVRLREKTNTEHLRLIFVAHSLGGLVVQNSLDLSRSSPEPHLGRLESNTVGLVFMGTPHFGSDKALWGRYCINIVRSITRPNKRIVEVLERDSEMLATIQKKFHEILRLRQSKGLPIGITCFYEELSYPGIGMIVEMNSAILPGYSNYGIHASHTGMAKFTSSLDKGYEAVSGELVRWVKDARSTATHTVELQEECLQCLYFDGLDSREESIDPPLVGTFAWIWHKEQCDFVKWLQDGRGLYWITGRASSGKSTLLKYITTLPLMEVRRRTAVKAPIIVSYFLGGKLQHPVGSTLEGIARAVLWQLFRKDQRHFNCILDHFQEMKRCRPNTDWKPSVLWEVLVQVLSREHPHGLWIFLDALDEFPGDLIKLAEACKSLADVASQRVRICVSSRPEQELLCTFNPTVDLQGSVLKLEDYTQDDITTFAKKEMARLSALLDDTSRRELVKSLSARANGLFMWVKLASRDIVRACMSGIGADAEELVQRLDNLPEEITELYLDILSKRESYRELVLLMLGVVEFGTRNFTLREFAFILNYKERYSRQADLDSLRRKCDALTGGLLDYQNGVVKFAHETVSSFLRTLLKEESYAVPLIKGCLRLGEACLLLLDSYQQSDGATHGVDKKRYLPVGIGNVMQDLISYSIQNWVHHLSYCASQEVFSDIFKTLSVTNDKVMHWHTAFLAQYWDHHSLDRRGNDPIGTTLAFLLYSVIPLEILSSSVTMAGDFGPEEDLDLLHISTGSQEWSRQNLDFIISVQLAPEYLVYFHAAQFLNNQQGQVKCRVVTRVANYLEFGQSQDLILALLDPSSSLSDFDMPVRFERCEPSGLYGVFGKEKKIKIQQPLFNEIQVVMWHCLQRERERLKPMGATIRKPYQAGNEELMYFPSPLHYTAFNGFNEVVKALRRFGANPGNISKDSSFGTPLMAAIWGLSEKGYATKGIGTIETLLSFRAVSTMLNVRANCASLGDVTPVNAAVKLYMGYRMRVGLESEDLKAVILLLINEGGAKIDAATRALAQSNPKLKRDFKNNSRETFSSWVSQNSPSSLPELSKRSFAAEPWARGPASIGDLGPFRSHWNKEGTRLAQSADGRFLPSFTSKF